MSFNKPAVAQVATSHTWVSSNDLYNMLKPSNDPNEYKVWGGQDIQGLMSILGDKNYVDAISYRHFEEDRLHQNIIAVGTGTGVVGATITYTVDATNRIAAYPTAPASPYVSTGTQINLLPVRKDEVLIFPNKAQGIVTAVTPSANTFDVTSTNGIALPTTSNAEFIINMGVSVGEGKDMPTSSNFRQKSYTNVVEIMEDSHVATGTSMGERTWVEYEYEGQKLASWYFKGQSGTYKRFRNFRELKLIAGEKVTAATGVNAYDPTLTRTEGLIPFATSYNAMNTYNKISGLTLEDYQNYYIDQIDKNGGATEYAAWNSITNRRDIEAFIRPEMQGGGVQYGAFGGGKTQAVNFGFSSFETLGYTTHLFTYSPFNNPSQLGASGHMYTNLTLMIPMSKDTYAVGEKKEKVVVPSIRTNYVKLGSYNREYEEFLTGGANGTYTSTVDELRINFRTHCGFEGFGANRFAAIQGI